MSLEKKKGYMRCRVYLLVLFGSSTLWGMRPSKATIDICGLDKKEILNALFNQAKPLLLENKRISSNDTLSAQEIEKVKKAGWQVGYMHDRALKVNISGDNFDPTFFNEANGQNAAQAAIETVRKSKK